MGIKVKVNWKFKINGKEYSSLKEMPANLREAYEKATRTSRITATKIVFNGQEYQNIEAMPQDARRVYDNMMRAAETGEIPSDVLSEAEYGLTAPDQGGKGVSRSHNIPRPIEPESTFSLPPRTLAVGLALLLILIGLYFVIAR